MAGEVHAPAAAARRLPLRGQTLEKGGDEHHGCLGDAEVVLRQGAVADDDAELGRGVDVDVLGADDLAGANAKLLARS